MRIAAVGLVVMLLSPLVCSAQSSAAKPFEPANKVQTKSAPADCKRNQTWSQTEERCVNIVTCEKAKKPWTLRCLINGDYKTARLQDLYKQGYYLKEISSKGAYFFRDSK